MDADNVKQFLLSIVGVAVMLSIGLLVLTSLQNTQTTYGATCPSGYTLNATNSAQCIEWTEITGKIKTAELLPLFNKTKVQNLSVWNKYLVSCTPLAYFNSSNNVLIGSQNVTRVAASGCTLVGSAKQAALWANQNMSVNYTYGFTNRTSAAASATGATHETIAANSTKAITTSLATIPQWIGIIITVALAFIVMGYFYNRM